MAATEKKVEEETKVIEEKQSVSGKRHLFGRQKPLHVALGSGKTADILLWRQKQMSGAIIVSATVIWLLFERIGYHLLPFLCHCLILTLAVLFLWSNLSSFVNKSDKSGMPILKGNDLRERLKEIYESKTTYVYAGDFHLVGGLSHWWLV
ncbi:reticulon [Artemisia annua]|uniref:Reticulon-like protein n=1 Tax=Artemisia annua TaxID=35608 RepID=A0A2U1MB78_ARTAN|nr:reticulon [Artemisia annua]